MIIWKPNYKAYPTLLPSEPFEFGGAVITPTQVLILGATAVSLAVLMWIVNGTRLGRAINSLEEIMEDLSHALQVPEARAARRSTSLLPTPG